MHLNNDQSNRKERNLIVTASNVQSSNNFFSSKSLIKLKQTHLVSITLVNCSVYVIFINSVATQYGTPIVFKKLAFLTFQDVSNRYKSFPSCGHKSFSGRDVVRIHETRRPDYYQTTEGRHNDETINQPTKN